MRPFSSAKYDHKIGPAAIREKRLKLELNRNSSFSLFYLNSPQLDSTLRPRKKKPLFSKIFMWFLFLAITESCRGTSSRCDFGIDLESTLVPERTAKMTLEGQCRLKPHIIEENKILFF